MGPKSPAQRREVLRAGACVGVICVDLAREALVLIRQFRLPAHLATGEGDLAEIVAGRVEPGEALDAAARREVKEETGLDAGAMVELYAFLPTPGIVDEHALADALRDGRLAAAGLDVFGEEPVSADNPLLALDNVVVTPHVTWYTADTMRRYLAEAVDNCERLRDGRELANVVNGVQPTW